MWPWEKVRHRLPEWLQTVAEHIGYMFLGPLVLATMAFVVTVVLFTIAIPVWAPAVFMNWWIEDFPQEEKKAIRTWFSLIMLSLICAFVIWLWRRK